MVIKRRVCLGCGDLADRGGLFCSRCREVTQGGLAKRIFVFTLDPEISAEIKTEFEPRGCKVHWEKNVDQGTEMLKKDVPDLIVMDIEAASIVSYELAKEVKASPVVIEMVIISAAEKGRQMFMDLGIKYFFIKPMDKIEFMKTIAKILTGQEELKNTPPPPPKK